MATPGLDSYGYGSPPYAEAAQSGKTRALLHNIGRLIAGAGQGIAGVRAGEGPFGAAVSGFGRSFIASQAARQAAESYALRKLESDREQEDREVRRMEREAKANQPPEPRKIPTNPIEMTPDEYGRHLQYLEDRAKIGNKYAKERQDSKPKTPKEPKQPTARETKLERETFALQNADDPNELIKVSQDAKLEPETRRAAWAKFKRLTAATNPSQVR